MLSLLLAPFAAAEEAPVKGFKPEGCPDLVPPECDPVGDSYFTASITSRSWSIRYLARPFVQAAITPVSPALRLRSPKNRYSIQALMRTFSSEYSNLNI